MPFRITAACVAALLLSGLTFLTGCSAAGAAGRTYSLPPQPPASKKGADPWRLNTTIVPPLLPPSSSASNLDLQADTGETPAVPETPDTLDTAALAFPQPEPLSQPKRVALTFDDGPSPVVTPRMLDLLDRYQAKATFFLLGQNAVLYPDLLTRMAASGHSIGNHTYTHVSPKKVTPEALEDELESTCRVICDATGARPILFRPPYGDMSRQQLSYYGMRVVFWSVDSWDWNLRDAQKVVERTLPEITDGSIVLLHDIYASTLEAAEMLLEALSAEGYEFVTVETLLNS